mgnify:CR=1 FL=1
MDSPARPKEKQSGAASQDNNNNNSNNNTNNKKVTMSITTLILDIGVLEISLLNSLLQKLSSGIEKPDEM